MSGNVLVNTFVCVRLCYYSWERVKRTHAVIAAPSSGGVGCLSHFLQGFSGQAAHLLQTAVVKDPRARPAGVQIVCRPNLTDLTHLIIDGLIAKQRERRQRQIIPYEQQDSYWFTEKKVHWKCIITHDRKCSDSSVSEHVYNQISIPPCISWFPLKVTKYSNNLTWH